MGAVAGAPSRYGNAAAAAFVIPRSKLSGTALPIV